MCRLWLVLATLTTFHLVTTQLTAHGFIEVPALSGLFAPTNISGHAAFFLIGITIALAKQQRRGWHLALIALALTDTFIPRDEQARLVIAITAAVTFLAANVRFPTLSRKLVIAPLALVGTISYALYIVNQNIGYVVMRAAYANGLTTFTGIALATLAAFTLAIVLTYAIVRPANTWLRRRLLKREKPPSLSSPA